MSKILCSECEGAGQYDLGGWCVKCHGNGYVSKQYNSENSEDQDLEKRRVRKYQKILIHLATLQEFGGDPGLIKNLRDELDERWKNLTPENQELMDQLSEDLYAFKLPNHENTDDPEVKIASLEKEVREWNESFKLFHKATRLLHQFYPHPDPLTHRDLGDVCRKAAYEIQEARSMKAWSDIGKVDSPKIK